MDNTSSGGGGGGAHSSGIDVATTMPLSSTASTSSDGTALPSTPLPLGHQGLDALIDGVVGEVAVPVRRSRASSATIQSAASAILDRQARMHGGPSSPPTTTTGATLQGVAPPPSSSTSRDYFTAAAGADDGGAAAPPISVDAALAALTAILSGGGEAGGFSGGGSAAAGGDGIAANVALPAGRIRRHDGRAAPRAPSSSSSSSYTHPSSTHSSARGDGGRIEGGRAGDYYFSAPHTAASSDASSEAEDVVLSLLANTASSGASGGAVGRGTGDMLSNSRFPPPSRPSPATADNLASLVASAAGYGATAGAAASRDGSSDYWRGINSGVGVNSATLSLCTEGSNAGSNTTAVETLSGALGTTSLVSVPITTAYFSDTTAITSYLATRPTVVHTAPSTAAAAAASSTAFTNDVAGAALAPAPCVYPAVPDDYSGELPPYGGRIMTLPSLPSRGEIDFSSVSDRELDDFIAGLVADGVALGVNMVGGSGSSGGIGGGGGGVIGGSDDGSRQDTDAIITTVESSFLSSEVSSGPTPTSTASVLCTNASSRYVIASDASPLTALTAGLLASASTHASAAVSASTAAVVSAATAVLAGGRGTTTSLTAAASDDCTTVPGEADLDFADFDAVLEAIHLLQGLAGESVVPSLQQRKQEEHAAAAEHQRLQRHFQQRHHRQSSSER